MDRARPETRFESAGSIQTLSESIGLVLPKCWVARVGPKRASIDRARLLKFWLGSIGRKPRRIDRAPPSGLPGRPNRAETLPDRSGTFSWKLGSAGTGQNLSKQIGLAIPQFAGRPHPAFTNPPSQKADRTFVSFAPFPNSAWKCNSDRKDPTVPPEASFGAKNYPGRKKKVESWPQKRSQKSDPHP